MSSIYTNERLNKFVEMELDRRQIGEKSRFIKDNLMDYLNSSTNRICGLYGLRRTGKTVLMYQAMKDLGYRDCAYILCNSNDDYVNMEEAIKNLSAKYIFVDEVTKVNDFVRLSSSLSDNFPEKKIVVAGTDSASLLLAKADELYDRVDFIHTTYISFAEYNYLLGYNLEDYIRYGGTLTNGNIFYNKDELDEYNNTAITLNIYHSIKNAGRDGVYPRLYDLYLNGSLISAVNKTIEIDARSFILNVMAGSFEKSHQFGSVKDLLKRHRDEVAQEDREKILDKWDSLEIKEYIADKLELGDSSDIKQSDIEIISDFMRKIDVIYEMPNKELVFMQPGMQYAFTEVLLDAVIESDNYQSMFPNTQELVRSKIIQDSLGHILEHVIKRDMIKCPILSEMDMGKTGDKERGEFDFFVINPQNGNALVYEIKRSNIIDDRQMHFLLDEDFCNEFENSHNCHIVERAVIYQGNPTIVCKDDKDICYYNASDFLINIEDKTKGLFVEHINEKDGLVDADIDITL